mmetsp:Transcript_91131/g.262835  ORF Transcript_91131/g.262835 Transcript_91131/m.262835 type:complete len:281 (+) Transcript_91131:98-940(+)
MASGEERTQWVLKPHIPKRATQHGLFVSSIETEPTNLKPGQTELHRRGLYVSEGKRAFIEKTFLSLDLPHRSEYSNAQATKPEHYTPRDCPGSSRWARAGDTDRDVSSGAAHWHSEYRRAGSEATASAEARQIARGTPRIVPVKRVGLVGCDEDSTAYRDHFGRLGANPRHRILPEDKKLPVHKTILNNGTTKASAHIPKYAGFIPANPFGPESARAASGEAVRSLDKMNITEIIHHNLVGYAGHVPSSFKNDFGGRQPTDLTTHGRDFVESAAQWPPGF